MEQGPLELWSTVSTTQKTQTRALIRTRRRSAAYLLVHQSFRHDTRNHRVSCIDISVFRYTKIYKDYCILICRYTKFIKKWILKILVHEIKIEWFYYKYTTIHENLYDKRINKLLNN